MRHTVVRSRIGDERGAVAVIVAIFMVVFLAIAALVIDLGALYDHDRELQSAADAGALAGAQELIYSEGNLGLADSQAREYVSDNAAVTSVEEANLVPWDPVVTASSVTVDLQEEHISYSFARVIGRTEGRVRAHAKAEVVYLTSIAGLFPIALPYVHPDHFEVAYGSGGPVIETGNSNDDGLYSTGNKTESMGLGPGLHMMTVTAHDKDHHDLISWDNVGSLYVPAAGAPIERVSVNRTISVPDPFDDPAGQVSEQVKVVIRTSEAVTWTTDPTIEVTVGGKTVTLSPVGPESDRIYASDLETLSTPDFTSGRADLTVTTAKKSGNGSMIPAGQTLARFAWFERGEPLVYIDQGPDDWQSGLWGWSAGTAQSNVTLSARIQGKIFKFGVPIMIKPGFQSEGEYKGNDFWADIFTRANLADELGAALGLVEPGDDWELQPDTAKLGGDGDGRADMGELLPSDNGKSTGQWKKVIEQGVGKTVGIPIVDPAEKTNGSRTWAIQTFAPFDIWSVQIDRNNALTIIGMFREDLLGTGEWTHDKPHVLYMKTAVLTE